MVWPVHTRAGSRRQGGDVREVGQHKIDAVKVQGHCTAFTSRGANTHKWLVAHQKKQAQEWRGTQARTVHDVGGQGNHEIQQSSALELDSYVTTASLQTTTQAAEFANKGTCDRA